jgi:hypothetical protein
VTSTRRPEAGTTGHAAGFDSELSEALVRTSRFFRRGEVSADLRSLHQIGGRDADSFYRDRWSHDKVVRSTHGVNCTGSCSWKVYVKDGIITWEAQQTDYPSTGPDRPEYEPRGCPRGAAFSWYTYSPTRVRYPYVRGSLEVLSRDPPEPLADSLLQVSSGQLNANRSAELADSRTPGPAGDRPAPVAPQRPAQRRGSTRREVVRCAVAAPTPERRAPGMTALPLSAVADTRQRRPPEHDR